jgi:hypothetical protein
VALLTPGDIESEKAILVALQVDLALVEAAVNPPAQPLVGPASNQEEAPNGKVLHLPLGMQPYIVECVRERDAMGWMDEAAVAEREKQRSEL